MVPCLNNFALTYSITEEISVTFTGNKQSLESWMSGPD